MSTNSAGGQFGTPHLPGYDIRWDEQAGEWVARRDNPAVELRGADQAALEAARSRVVMDLAADMRGIFQYAPQHGYTPPPRS